jgi:hypothetical protein
MACSRWPSPHRSAGRRLPGVRQPDRAGAGDRWHERPLAHGPRPTSLVRWATSWAWGCRRCWTCPAAP